MPRVTEIARKVLGEVIANSLNTDGCTSAEEFLKRYDHVKEVNKYTIGEKNLALLRCAIISQYKSVVKAGNHLSQRALQRTTILRTGSSQVDKVLDNGLYTCEVVQVYGPSACGKTQLAFQTAALACIKQNCNVIYVDTSNSFSSERVQDVLNHYNTTPESINGFLENILVCNIFDVFELQDLLHSFISTSKSKSDPFNLKVKLLVIDSITTLMNPILGYKSPEGYAIASSVATLLRRIACELHVAVLVINGTVGGLTSRGFPKPALGIQWQQMADKILLITGFDSTSVPAVYNCQLVASSKHGLAL